MSNNSKNLWKISPEYVEVIGLIKIIRNISSIYIHQRGRRIKGELSKWVGLIYALVYGHLSAV